MLPVENTPTAAHLVLSEPTATLFYELLTNTDFELRLWWSNCLLIFTGHVSVVGFHQEHHTAQQQDTVYSCAADK